MDVDNQPKTPGSKGESSLVLPLARVRKLIKAEGDIKMVSGEASFLIARATELFLESFAEGAGKQMQSNKRNQLTYSDVAENVADAAPLEFLSDIVPKKIKMSELPELFRQANEGEA